MNNDYCQICGQPKLYPEKPCSCCESSKKIQIKSLLSSLLPNEEIVYKAEKSKEVFIYSMFICIFPFCFLFIGLLLSLINPDFPLQYRVFSLFLSAMFSLGIYKMLKDYLYTEIYVTNQRLIISVSKRLFPIEYNQINYIRYGFTGRAGAIPPVIINLKSKKTYKIFFLNVYKLKQAIQKIYNDYDDSKIIEEQNGNAVMWLVILLPIIPFIMFYLLKWIDKIFP